MKNFHIKAFIKNIYLGRLHDLHLAHQILHLDLKFKSIENEWKNFRKNFL